MHEVCSKVIAGCFALAAFAVAIVTGLISNVPAAQILLRSLLAMIVCYPIGLVVGRICQSVISAHIAEHKSRNPLPEQSPSAEQLVQTDTASDSNEEEVIIV